VRVRAFVEHLAAHFAKSELAPPHSDP
jgi:hypothetical protein